MCGQYSGISTVSMTFVAQGRGTHATATVRRDHVGTGTAWVLDVRNALRSRPEVDSMKAVKSLACHFLTLEGQADSLGAR